LEDNTIKSCFATGLPRGLAGSADLFAAAMMITIGMTSAVMGIGTMIGRFCGFGLRLLSNDRQMDGREIRKMAVLSSI
jgi:hypothetical protein